MLKLGALSSSSMFETQQIHKHFVTLCPTRNTFPQFKFLAPVQKKYSTTAAHGETSAFPLLPVLGLFQIQTQMCAGDQQITHQLLIGTLK